MAGAGVPVVVSLNDGGAWTTALPTDGDRGTPAGNDGRRDAVPLSPSHPATSTDRHWQAHRYEAWCATFDLWQRDVVYTGGDDALWKSWDLRTDLAQPLYRGKAHAAGVTAIASHPTRPYVLATGRYASMCT